MPPDASGRGAPRLHYASTVVFGIPKTETADLPVGAEMPHATPCLDCGAPTPFPKKGRCPQCQRERDRNDYYQSAEWRRIAAHAKRRGGGACAICGSTERTIAHHSQARREGGTDAVPNIVLLCGSGAVGMPWLSCHSQYEADKRTGKHTELRKLVESL